MKKNMAINTYLSTIDYVNKNNRDRIMDTERILKVARWEGVVGKWVKR